VHGAAVGRCASEPARLYFLANWLTTVSTTSAASASEAGRDRIDATGRGVVGVSRSAEYRPLLVPCVGWCISSRFSPSAPSVRWEIRSSSSKCDICCRGSTVAARTAAMRGRADLPNFGEGHRRPGGARHRPGGSIVGPWSAAVMTAHERSAGSVCSWPLPRRLCAALAAFSLILYS